MTDRTHIAVANHEEVVLWQLDSQVRDDPMFQEIQFWRLTVNADRSAVLSCERDQGDIAVTQEIEFTDFPLPSITLYLQQGTLLLPSEY